MDHRLLLTGQQRGVVAAATRGALWVASGGYHVATRIRGWQYESGRREICRADVPVISVGNLTTGGTGKTPIVADLCRRMRKIDRRVAIISRGYGAGESGMNDEAMELAERLPDVPHVQHIDRVEAARIAVEELEAEVIVMDDGFQHRRLHRDLNLLVVDATNPWGGGYLLPRGYLREPISALRRADAVVVSRADQVDAPEIASIVAEVQKWRPEMPIAETIHRPARLTQFNGEATGVQWLSGRSVIAVSAIGNPSAFDKTLRAAGATVVGRIDFPDHDPYDRPARDRLRVEVAAIVPRADAVVCTHKDFVKLATDSVSGVPLFCLQIDLAFRRGEAELDGVLRRCVESFDRQQLLGRSAEDAVP